MTLKLFLRTAVNTSFFHIFSLLSKNGKEAYKITSLSFLCVRLSVCPLVITFELIGRFGLNFVWRLCHFRRSLCDNF
jgi:hypothetical protein